jgi:phage virion morphogenesis protein
MRIGRGNSKILQLSLRLRNNIKPFYYDDKAGVGVNLKYAAIHQFGGRAGKGHRSQIPARPYLGLDQPAREKIVRLTVKMLNEAITEELAKSLNS